MDIIVKKVKDIQSFMKLTYGIVPIVAGADKFTNLLVNWSDYLNPSIAGMLPFSAETFMLIVGVIEILAGILVLFKTRLGALVVASWLVLIALTLLLSGKYLDVAVRDLVMAVGAFVLFQLSEFTEKMGSKAAA